MTLLSWLHLSLWVGLGLWLLVLLDTCLNLMLVHTLDENDARALDRANAFTSPEKYPRISILVPARDEAKRIEKAVRSYCSQDYPNYEVLVVNDRSTDETGDILARLSKEYPHLKIIEGTEPPAGWLGKPHALHLAEQRASGEWLLFVDADLIYHPKVLAASLARALSRHLDMVTGPAHFEQEGFWETLFWSYAVQGFLTYPLFLLNQRWFKEGYALGAYTFIKREAYAAIGGHKAVRSAILDDIRIGRNLKRSGRSAEIVFGDRLMRIRMYEGFGEIWRGFGKNLFDLIGGSVATFVLFLPVQLATQVLPFLLLPTLGARALLGSSYDPLSLRLVLGWFAVFLLCRGVIQLRFPVPLWTIPMYPVGSAIWCAIAVRSFYDRKIKKSVSWRGRAYRQT